MPVVFSAIGPMGPIITYDAATVAWVNAVIANGGTVSLGRKAIVDTLIVGLKADGLFTKLDRLWLFAGENEPSALTDIIADALATAVNSPAFVVDRGYTGDGATSVIDTNFNPTVGTPLFVLDSHHFSVWSNTAAQSAKQDIGNAFTGFGVATHIYCRFTDELFYYSDMGSVTDAQQTVSDGSGHFLGTRTASNVINNYRNASVGTAGNQASSSLTNKTFWVGGCNDPATPDYGVRQSSAASFGIGLVGGDVTALYSRLRTYMTAVGVP
jgi:hypothetical protein